MQVDYKKLLISGRGDNKTVIKVIQEVFNEYKNSCNDLVIELLGHDIRTAALSVFTYVIQNITYKMDDGNNQYIKTPARLLADKQGDCKSMAVFIASCLYCLGIKCKFRFVSFTNDKIYTHVYVVANDEKGNDIIIDPVERVKDLPKFDYCSSYTHKIDIYAR